ncbi:HEPN domain protein [Phycisphaerae bacterium RAS1]|nr:HEPN domain protein [Phycisphaerae bacterium RAS1]
MKPLTREWIAKAEEDFAVARREMRTRTHPAFGAICFHAQQCAEKYLKARLCESGTPIERTHDLAKLLAELAKSDAGLGLLAPAADGLTSFGVKYRYPGATASRADARGALRAATLIREAMRMKLGVPIAPKRRKRAPPRRRLRRSTTRKRKRGK